MPDPAPPWHANREVVFVVMRQLDEEAERKRRKAIDLQPRYGQVGVGGADFDLRLWAEVAWAYLRVLRHGGAPAEALAAATAAGEECVRIWNERTCRGRMSVFGRHELERSKDSGGAAARYIHAAFAGFP